VNNFIHFKTRGETNLFKCTYNHFQYGHECCYGKGILVYNKTSCELNDLKNQLFSNKDEEKTYVKCKISECVVCYYIKQSLQNELFTFIL
jgi:hypothetical protein